MPTNPMIWSEVWNRASIEELGIALEVVEPDSCIQYLHKFRPPGFEEYSVMRTPDPNLLLIAKPHVTMDDPDVLRELGLAPDLPEDQTPDLED